MRKTLLRRAKKAPKYIHSLLCRAGMGVFCYQMEVRMLQWFCSLGWIQRSLFSGREKLFRRFLEETGLDERFELRDLVCQNLVASVIRYWWFGVVRYWSDADFEQIVTVEGWERVERASAKGKGMVFVHHHITTVHLVWNYLDRRGFGNRVTIGKELASPVRGVKGDRGVTHKPATELKLDYLRQLQSAKTALNAGGVVRIVPDGFRGDSSGIEVPFFNRMRQFRSGFAELALTTGAEIIPTSASMDPLGHFTISFHEPLYPGKGKNRKDQVIGLVSAYVRYLDGQWHSPTVNFLSVPNIRKYLALPRVGAAEKP